MFRSQLSEAEYQAAAAKLITWFSVTTRYSPDIELTSREVLEQVREIARAHSLDFSDAFQIVSVKHGRFSRLANENQTVLVTADFRLAEAARREGLRAWDVLNEVEP